MIHQRRELLCGSNISEALCKEFAQPNRKKQLRVAAFEGKSFLLLLLQANIAALGGQSPKGHLGWWHLGE